MKKILNEIMVNLIKENPAMSKFPVDTISVDKNQITIPLIGPVRVIIRKDEIRLTNNLSNDIVITPTDLVREVTDIISFLMLIHVFTFHAMLEVASAPNESKINKEVLN